MKVLTITVALSCAVAPAFAQVNVTGTQTADKSSASAQVSVTTMDRSFVPLTIETKQTKVDAATTRSDSVTRAQLNDGSYFDWRTTSTITRSNATSTQATTDTIEKDRQGDVRATKSSTKTVTTTPQGQQSSTTNYRRDASGRLVAESETTAVTTRNPDGSLSTAQVEKRAGLEGDMRPVRQIEETTIAKGDNDSTTVRKISDYDHLGNRFGLTAQETTRVQADGNTTRSETRVQKPSGAGWNDEARIITTETRAANGSARREIIEEGRSLYAKQTGTPSSVEPLQPQRKIVEEEVRKPDGTMKLERQVFRRDINGDWKPATFSTDAAGSAY
jgi:hypothetical protein